MSNPEKEMHFSALFFIYLSYGVLILAGRIRDLVDTMVYKLSKYIFLPGIANISDYNFKHHNSNNNSLSFSKNCGDFAPITRASESFFRRRLYGRVVDCWNRPICSAASSRMDVIDRDIDSLKHLKAINCLNLASYNYLGFGSPGHKICEPAALEALKHYGISTCSSSCYGGTTALHDELERYVCDFLDVEAAMVFGMGWGTNCTAIPALVGKGCLIISDSINHNSIVAGAKLSGAKIKTFKHNDMNMLEKIVRRAIIDGQPKTHRAWKKILIIVEGK